MLPLNLYSAVGCQYAHWNACLISAFRRSTACIFTTFLSLPCCRVLPGDMPCKVLRRLANHFVDFYKCVCLAVELFLPNARHVVAELRKAYEKVNPSDVAFMILLQWRHSVCRCPDTLHQALLLIDLKKTAKLLISSVPSFHTRGFIMPPFWQRKGKCLCFLCCFLFLYCSATTTKRSLN